MADREHEVKKSGQTAGSRPEVRRSSQAAGSRPEVRRSSQAAGSRPEVRRSSQAAGSRPEVRRSSQAAGSRPEVKRSSQTAGSRPEVRRSSQAAGSRPEVRRSSQAAGSRPEVRRSSQAAGTRPKSATSVQRTRTSTGRPLNKEQGTAVKKTVTGKTTAGRNNRAGGTRKRNTSGRRTGSSNVALDPRAMFIAAAVVGIVLALLITIIMRASMLRVRQIEKDYNIGDTFDIKNYFEPANKDTVLECDTSKVTPDKLGKYKVKFTIRRGKMSRTKKGRINVVDEVKPFIEGPDEIEVPVGENIRWSDYYTVTDEDPDIQGKLKSVNDIDTDKARAVSATLTVTDWAGNESTKDITVIITDQGTSK